MAKLRLRNLVLPLRRRKTQLVRAPEVMDVTDGAFRARAMKFLTDIEHYLSIGSSVRLCFGGTKKLHPCGTLVFVSHVEVWQRKYPGRLRLRDLPEDEVVAQLFKHIGLLEKLGMSVDLETSHEMVRDWHFHSGETMDAATYKVLALSAQDYIDHPDKGLFPDCLNEAVANTCDHAYEIQVARLPPPDMRRWWMFSQVRDGKLSVVIYDQGIGIPKSLLSKPQWRDVIKKIHQKDGRLIEAAVCSPRTRTLLPYRGKGLPEMLEFTSSLREGRLSIMSARGGFFFNAATENYRRTRYDVALPGTLVMWGIPVSDDLPIE